MLPSDLNRFVARTEDLLRAATAFNGIHRAPRRHRSVSRRVADRLIRRFDHLDDAVPLHAGITIRYAFPDDACELARLAALDSSPPLATPALVAEIEGEIRVALSVADGAVIADPFHRTAGLISLLINTTRREITPLQPQFQTPLIRLGSKRDLT